MSGKVAVANRGEVAVRILRACQELGLKTVLLHSEPDENSIAYRLADETYCLGAGPSSESYLNQDRHLEALKETGAKYLHPGFGFLSENGEFAQRVQNAGVVFIGPRPETILQMGDKVAAKKLIEAARVPSVPGYNGEEQSVDRLVQEAEKIGYPVIAKAAAGGGGRGMKILRDRDSSRELIESAQREAQSAFGSSVVFLEKYLDRAKHIEFQIFGDGQGEAVHLGERDCSVQRRHQKIIEEAPAPSLSPELREAMGQAACALAKACKYRGAGTVEFLVQDDSFYFLEMNTRLQVEHPVTELVYGVDLVKSQILLAMGEFELWQNLKPRGHAIECRIYAEDSQKGGMPSTGRLGTVRWPEGPGRRFDAGFEKGDEITSYYDSMIAKVIVWDESRTRALQKIRRTLKDCIVFGVKTNFDFLELILSHSEFSDGTFNTQFLPKHFPNGLAESSLSEEQLGALKDLFRKVAPETASGTTSLDSQAGSPWARGWRVL